MIKPCSMEVPVRVGWLTLSLFLWLTTESLAISDTPASKDSATTNSTFKDPRQPQDTRQAGGTTQVADADRWRVLDAYGVQVPRYSIINPYYQNPLKGDFPIAGNNTFAVVTLVGNPVSVFTNQEGVETQFNNKLVTALEFFHGATVFKPKDWSVKASGQGLFNRGNNKDLDDFAILELFGEVKLFDIGPYYDFTSLRGGLQPFLSDFNGFIFRDINLGGVLFGELNQNRNRWNLAFFSQRKKENGQLTFDPQEQEVGVANMFIEDFLRPGFNGVFSFHYNRDRSLQSLSPQTALVNDLDIFYAGFAADGRWGRFEFNPAVYFAFGSEKLNPIANQETSVSAFMAGVEFAYQKEYRKYRAAYFFASGDSDPTDDKAQGFDSINDNINLFGVANGFAIGNPAFGMRPNSFLPANRTQGVANFVNPGIHLINVGLDAVFTPKLFFEANYNHLRFVNTASLTAHPHEVPLRVFGVRHEVEEISTALGHEINAGFNYRLFLNENFVIRLGGAAFFPLEGGKQLLGKDDVVINGNIALVLLY